MAREEYKMKRLGNDKGHIGVEIISAPYKPWVGVKFMIPEGKKGYLSFVLSEPDDNDEVLYSPKKMIKYFENINPRGRELARGRAQEKKERDLEDFMLEDPEGSTGITGEQP